MSRGPSTCAICGAVFAPSDRFCENCGTILSAVGLVAVPAVAKRPSGPCADCGGETYVDEYCAACGHRRTAPDRDRADLEGIVLISDRGRDHLGNEDAAAAGTLGCGHARATAVAVCDGVSASTAAHTAARSASTAGVDAMLKALAAQRTPESVLLAGLSGAAEAAAAVGAGSSDPATAAACTYAAAAVVPGTAGTVQIAVGSVGDSRVYWIPDGPAPAQCLTVDDSLAQELITAGVPADSDAVQSGAHTLTRWLGADAGATPWSESSVRTITTAQRGVLVLCTDGLWNYLPDPDGIAGVCAGRDAGAAATELVDYALRAGGQDNITVAVVPIGDPS